MWFDGGKHRRSFPLVGGISTSAAWFDNVPEDGKGGSVGRGVDATKDSLPPFDHDRVSLESAILGRVL